MQKSSSLIDSPRVMADHLLLEVFLNLYANAVRYTPRREVEIETALLEEEEEYPAPGEMAVRLEPFPDHSSIPSARLGLAVWD